MQKGGGLRDLKNYIRKMSYDLENGEKLDTIEEAKINKRINDYINNIRKEIMHIEVKISPMKALMLKQRIKEKDRARILTR